MFNFFQSIAVGGSAAMITSMAALLGAFSQPNIVVVNPQQILVLPAPTSTELIRQEPIVTAAPAASSSPSSSPVIKFVSPKQSAKTEQAQPQSFPVQKITTAQQLFAQTDYSLNFKLDGGYWLSLHTTTTAKSGFDWSLPVPSIGGTNSIPKFSVSYSCDPQPDIPSLESPDQNPVLSPNTSYSCSVSLTDSFSRTASKQMKFLTGNGRMTVKASSLSTLLQSNKSVNGFVFDNQSDSTITITGLTFDASFTALNTSNPVMLRFADPKDESSLADFSVQNLQTDASKQYTRSSAGLNVSLSFAVKPHTQRLLWVELLGAQQLMSVGVNPEFDVTLRQMTTDHPEIKTAFFSPVISWICVPYNPYTSGGAMPNEQNCN